MQSNQDARTVTGFGEEWTYYDQADLSEGELQQVFDLYFNIFPWDRLTRHSVGFDLGCGSGRWARVAAPRIGHLYCIDASEAALAIARKNLAGRENCSFVHASVDHLPFDDGTFDFGYSLGVLHHVPDTLAGIRACVRKLKPGAPLLLYIYYAFDNRPAWFRLLWRLSDLVRDFVSRLPFGPRNLLAQLIALLVYWPLARTARLLEILGFNVERLPLSIYRNNSFYVMRTDALDRFGTRLEYRFTAAEIQQMMQAAGLERITFSQSAPYWCAVGYKK
ncbi:MAG: class I SAM-dependent methyltransferase [Blastocatellia bacterium]